MIATSDVLTMVLSRVERKRLRQSLRTRKGAHSSKCNARDSREVEDL